MEVDAPDTAPADHGAVQGPLVFQCNKCSQIVGDSFAMLEASQELSSIILTGVVHCRESGKLLTVQEGYDLGCTYNAVTCEGCEAEIGRVYKTTSRKLDYARDMFTLFTLKLKSYTVGSGGVLPQTGQDSTVAETQPAQAEKEKAPDFAELLEREKNRLQAEIDDHQRKLELQHDTLRKQADLLENMKKEHGQVGRHSREPSHGFQADINQLQGRIADIDETLGKFKQLWVRFDERVRALEGFTSGLLAVAGTEPPLPNGEFMQSPDNGGAESPDGLSAAKRAKRKR